jgi:MATE family multidrug resistance protein
MPFISKDWIAEARVLTGISLSVTLTMFAQLAISAVETLAVARLGVHALAGVTLALSIYLLVFLFALGIVTAVTPIAAQARGRGNRDALRRIGQQGLWVSLTVSLPGVVVLLGCGRLLRLVLGCGPEVDSASDYLLGAAWGLPAWVCYVAVRSLAVATGHLRATTVVMLASIPCHAGLTWWLVFGGMGVPPLEAFGAGIAYSVTALAAWGMIAVIAWAWPAQGFGGLLRRPFLWDGELHREILRLGIPFACRILLREGVLPVAALAIAPFGASVVAAHAVAARVLDLAGIFCFGFSDAANMRVAYALGAGMPHHAARSGWIAIQLSAGTGLLVATTLLATSHMVARWFLADADPATLVAATALLPIAAVLLFLEAVQSATGGALSGMRDAKGPLLMAVAGSWAIGMPLGIVLANNTAMPALGLWTGLATGAALTALLYLLRFRQRIGGLRSPG